MLILAALLMADTMASRADVLLKYDEFRRCVMQRTMLAGVRSNTDGDVLADDATAACESEWLALRLLLTRDEPIPLDRSGYGLLNSISGNVRSQAALALAEERARRLAHR